MATVLPRSPAFTTASYAIVRYTGGVTHPGNVDLYDGTFQDITAAALGLT